MRWLLALLLAGIVAGGAAWFSHVSVMADRAASLREQLARTQRSESALHEANRALRRSGEMREQQLREAIAALPDGGESETEGQPCPESCAVRWQ